MKNDWKRWFQAAGIRALKTVAQTAAATVGASTLLSEVNWGVVCVRPPCWPGCFRC